MKSIELMFLLSHKLILVANPRQFSEEDYHVLHVAR